MKSTADLCWTCRLETRHLFLTFRGAKNRSSFAMGGQKALNVKMDLDHLQKESHSGAVHAVPSAPVITLRSDPAAVIRVLSLLPHPPMPNNLVWLVSSQQFSVDALSRERERHREKKALPPAFVPRKGFLKHPGISDLLLNLGCVFFLPENLKPPLFSKIRLFLKFSFFFFF